MSKYLTPEIIPPSRISVDVPGYNAGSRAEAYLDRKRFEYAERAAAALTVLNKTEAALFDAQTRVIESTINRNAKLVQYQEQPRVLGHWLALRQMDREEEVRQKHHTHEVNESRRQKELAILETELTAIRAALMDARTDLLNSEQKYRAQEEHGYFTYEIAHKKKQLELLEIQLSEAERRAYMKGKLDAIETPDDEIYDILRELRQQMADGGLDTSRLDAALARRKK